MRFERLGNIVTIAKGKKPAFSESPNENSVRVLQIDDLRNNNNIKYTDDKTGVFAKEEDVLIAWDGANAGTIGFGKTGYIGSTIALLRKKNSKDFDTVFIGKFLQSQSEFLRRKSTGATIPHIDRKSLESLRIPILSVSDQLQIANILIKAENLISQRKQSIALLDEFLKSTFLEMFGDPVRNEKGWKVETIDKLCVEIVDCVNKTAPLVDNPTDFIMIRTTNVRDLKINFNDTRFVSKEIFDKWTRRLHPEKGDIIFTREAPVGEAAIIDFSKNVFLGQRTMQFRPNIKVVNKYYLLFQLMGSDVKQQINKLSSGSTVKHLSVPACKKFSIKVPPLELQSRFAQIVEKTEALKSQYQSSLRELENLYGSLSQQAFQGDLNFSEADTSV